MDECPVAGIAEDRRPVPKLDGNDPGPRGRADPCQDGIAIGVVGREQGLDPGRHPHAFVCLVNDMEWPDSASDRVLRGRCDEDLLGSLDGGRGGLALALQAISAADDLFIPPGPLLIVEQGMVQDHDAFAALDEVAEVLPALSSRSREKSYMITTSYLPRRSL